MTDTQKSLSAADVRKNPALFEAAAAQVPDDTDYASKMEALQRARDGQDPAPEV